MVDWKLDYESYGPQMTDYSIQSMWFLNRDQLQKDKLDKPFKHPVVKFNYTFKYPFLSLAQAEMRRYNWECKSNNTIISDVSQPNDDTFVYFHRQERVEDLENLGWERVTINRATGVMEVDVLNINPDHTDLLF